MSKVVMVTGSKGFLGKHLTALLLKNGNKVVEFPGGYDLRDPLEVDRRIKFERPEQIFHLAGVNGGINFHYPARIFHDNTIMALNVMESAKKYHVDRVALIITSCGYPAHCQDLPESCAYKEWEYLNGPIYPSNAEAHGQAKRNLYLMSRFYYEEHKLKSFCLLPTTLYGPGDSFDLHKTKVVGALVKKLCDAKREGKQESIMYGRDVLREVLYVDDAAQLILKAMDVFNEWSGILNLGSGQEFSIKKLAEIIAQSLLYNIRFEWQEGLKAQPRKRLDLTKMHKVLGDFNFTSIEDGIAKTIKYYESQASSTR